VKPNSGRTKHWNGSRTNPSCWLQSRRAGAQRRFARGAGLFGCPRSKKRGDTLTSGWPGGMCCWPGKSSGRLLLREGAVTGAQGLVHHLAGGKDSVLLWTVRPRPETRPGSDRMALEPLRALASQGQCQQASVCSAPPTFLTQARQLNPRCSEAEAALVALSQTGFWDRMRAGAGGSPAMSAEKLDQCLAAAVLPGIRSSPRRRRCLPRFG